MIISIVHKGLRVFWEDNNSAMLPPACIEKIRRVLYILDQPSPLKELKLLRRYKLHLLTGNYVEYWSLHITANYRIIFKVINEGEVHLVNFLDYHKK